jgi:low temperature requirement protein LtrA
VTDETTRTTLPAPETGEGKRVSWVELYLDLIVVLAIAQLSQILADEEIGRRVLVTLGLFLVVWWTWIGFAVLYNRNAGDTPETRLMFLVGSIPMGVAAVAIAPAATGDSGMFAASMAAVRLVLCVAHLADGGWRDVLRQRTSRAYLISATVFAVSIVVPAPWRYVMWALTLAGESSVVLISERDREHHRGPRRRERLDLRRLKPTQPGEALDAHHFAERFGLFIIILLGEVVVEAGQASVDGHVATAGGWFALVCAMVLAAALWWLYFDAAVEINLKVLELSGGSPIIARGLFAIGHMLPTFGLLLTAAGVGLLLEHEPTSTAYWYASTGVGTYFVSTRVITVARTRPWRVVRFVMILATFAFGVLHHWVSPHVYLALLAAWVVFWVGTASWEAHHGELEALQRRVLG